MGRNPRENLQLRPQVHERSAREAPAGRPLHRTQPKNRQIHHILPLHCKVNLIWNRYKDRLSGTAEEDRAVAPGVLSQFGTYSVNQAEGTLTVHVETSSFPNENGTDHERIITSISVDKLQWTDPTPTTPGIAYSTLSRARAAAEPPR